MATKVEWSKAGLKLVCETSKRALPKTGIAFPLPDFGSTGSPLIQAALEIVLASGRVGIRVTTLSAGLPTMEGKWALYHRAYSGTSPESETWDTLDIYSGTINFLLDPALPDATHEFFLENVSGDRTTIYPTVYQTTPAMSDTILSAGWQKVAMQARWAYVQTVYSDLVSQASRVFHVADPTASPYEAHSLKLAYDSLNAVHSYWADETVSSDISALTPGISSRWAEWDAQELSLRTNIAYRTAPMTIYFALNTSSTGGGMHPIDPEGGTPSSGNNMTYAEFIAKFGVAPQIDHYGLICDYFDGILYPLPGGTGGEVVP